MKDYINKTEEAIREWLENLDNGDLIAVHNAYCQASNDYDSEIYDNGEEFFETFFSGKVMDAIRAIGFGEYSYSDNYIKFNGLANLETTDNPEDWVDYDELTEFVLENEEEVSYLVELEEVEEDDEDDADLLYGVDNKQ